MHIPDGILPAQVSAVGYAIAVPLVGYSLRTINRQAQNHLISRTIPKAALLTATFFVASSLYLPFPPPVGSLHFLMNGLLGALLGYYAIPAIVIGLLLQALLLGHGGLTTLGINTVLLGIPALLAYGVFQSRHWFVSRFNQRFHLNAQLMDGLFGGLAGCIGVMGSALLFFSIVMMTIPADIDGATEQAAISLMTLIHVPLALLEGAFTASFVIFLHRTKPELLDANQWRSLTHHQGHRHDGARYGRGNYNGANYNGANYNGANHNGANQAEQNAPATARSQQNAVSTHKAE